MVERERERELERTQPDLIKLVHAKLSGPSDLNPLEQRFSPRLLHHNSDYLDEIRQSEVLNVSIINHRRNQSR